MLMATSFAKDVRPLFREIDIDHMEPFGVTLGDYGYMSDASNDHRNARDVFDYLSGKREPQMPPGGPYWSKEQLDLYEKWMADGYQP
jgi:hypothetical protein